MAEALGVDRSTYRLFVAGRNRAGRKIIGGVARAFPEVNVAYFAAQDVEMAAEAATAHQGAREHSTEGKPTPMGGNGRTTQNREASDGLGTGGAPGSGDGAGDRVARSGYGGVA